MLSSSHGTFELALRSERRSGPHREHAGTVFDRCVLLLELVTSRGITQLCRSDRFISTARRAFGVSDNSGRACHNRCQGRGIMVQ